MKKKIIWKTIVTASAAITLMELHQRFLTKFKLRKPNKPTQTRTLTVNQIMIKL